MDAMEQNNKGKTKPDDGHQLAWSQEIPNYGNKLLKRLDEFRKTTILYDIRVRADGGEFNAHKVILAACGGLFRTCFVDEKKKMISGDIAELSLACPAQGLKPIIRFAYTGALVVTKRNAMATMIAAELTKMKEVQEICAKIASEEYGWIIHFVGEKDAATVESLGKVLQLHAPCFTAVLSNGNHSDGNDRALPFAEEVEKVYPEHTTTYRMLATKLESAEALLASSKSDTKDGSTKEAQKSTQQGDETKSNSEDSPASTEVETPKETDPTSSEPPVPNVRSRRTKSDEAKKIKTDVKDDTQEVCEENSPEIATSLAQQEGKSPNDSNPKPRRPPVAHRKSKSDVTSAFDATQAAPPVSEEKTPKRPSPPTPKTQTKEEAVSKTPNVAPKRSSVKDKDAVKVTVSSDGNESSDTTPKKSAPPASPRIKPRSSVKSKKAAPAPPPPTLAPPVERSPKTAAPPRPKALPKVPPPRPKPPLAKKISTDPEGAAAKKQVDEMAGDYDETLNPFA